MWSAQGTRAPTAMVSPMLPGSTVHTTAPGLPRLGSGSERRRTASPRSRGTMGTENYKWAQRMKDRGDSNCQVSREDARGTEEAEQRNIANGIPPRPARPAPGGDGHQSAAQTNVQGAAMVNTFAAAAQLGAYPETVQDTVAQSRIYARGTEPRGGKTCEGTFQDIVGYIKQRAAQEGGFYIETMSELNDVVKYVVKPAAEKHKCSYAGIHSEDMMIRTLRAGGTMGRKLFEAKARFEAYEIVRSDNGSWGAVENVASLPIGALSSPAWLKRLTHLTILDLPGKVWAQNARPMAASWLVRLTFDAKESSSGAFRVSKETVTRRQGAWVTVNLHDGAEVGQFSDLRSSKAMPG